MFIQLQSVFRQPLPHLDRKIIPEQRFIGQNRSTGNWIPIFQIIEKINEQEDILHIFPCTCCNIFFDGNWDAAWSIYSH